MINIVNKQNCCGCGACEQVCPKQCISMSEDKEGFLYPIVDVNNCIDCNLCNKVCPVLNRYSEPLRKPASYACKSLDDNLIAKSSSGGFFSILAEFVIRKGGVVFGARFEDNWSVRYDYTETVDGLSVFRGSKYVQAEVGLAYKNVKKFLVQGRWVLFTGTPCHVSGLNHYLRKKYDKLLTLDFVCHSIPSPMVWRDYLKSVSSNRQITYITFRDKSFGWDNYGIKVSGISSDMYTVQNFVHGSHKENIYMRAFLSNLTARPSCFSCPARCYTSGSDIMMADCWGFNTYHPEINDNKGMSLVLPVSPKGIEIFNLLKDNLFVLPIPYDEVEEETNHSPLIRSAKEHFYRQLFFDNYSSTEIESKMTYYVNKGEKRKKRIESCKSFIRYLIGTNNILKIRKILCGRK